MAVLIAMYRVLSATFCLTVYNVESHKCENLSFITPLIIYHLCNKLWIGEAKVYRLKELHAW